MVWAPRSYCARATIIIRPRPRPDAPVREPPVARRFRQLLFSAASSLVPIVLPAAAPRCTRRIPFFGRAWVGREWGWGWSLPRFSTTQIHSCHRRETCTPRAEVTKSRRAIGMCVRLRVCLRPRVSACVWVYLPAELHAACQSHFLWHVRPNPVIRRRGNSQTWRTEARPPEMEP